MLHASTRKGTFMSRPIPNKALSTTLVCLIAAAFLACASTSTAADLRVLSGNGARAAVTELAQRYERASGNKVTVDFAVNPQTRKKIESGEPFDVAILNPPQLDAL